MKAEDKQALVAIGIMILTLIAAGIGGSTGAWMIGGICLFIITTLLYGMFAHRLKKDINGG